MRWAGLEERETRALESSSMRDLEEGAEPVEEESLPYRGEERAGEELAERRERLSWAVLRGATSNIH